MNSGCFTNLHEPPQGSPTFVSQFREAGYRTMAVGKSHMRIHAYDADYTSPAHRCYMSSLGWDDTCEVSGNGMFRTGIRCSYSEFLQRRGMLAEVADFYGRWGYFMDPHRKADHTFLPHVFPFDESLKETAFIGQAAVDWLCSRPDGRPFLMHVGFAGPHSPIEPLGRLMDFYRERPEPPPGGWDDVPDWVLDGRRGYRAMITEVDEWIGRIRDCLARRGELDDTIFVYTSDHGEMAGDHQRFDKCCFFEGAVHVPLVISMPAGPVRGASDALVETIDIGRTLCDLCGVTPHPLDQGHSLLGLLLGQRESHRESIYVEMGCDRMIFDGRYKLMWGDPTLDTRQLGRLHLEKPVTIAHSPCRLYDLEADPGELRDLAGDHASRPLLMRMMEGLMDRTNQNLQPLPLQSRGEYRPLAW